LAVHGASEEVEQHLAMGMKLVSAGQLSDALSHYHAAVGMSDYKSIHPVSTVYTHSFYVTPQKTVCGTTLGKLLLSLESLRNINTYFLPNLQVHT
jgi:hypothetical protein